MSCGSRLPPIWQPWITPQPIWESSNVNRPQSNRLD